jgi:Mn-dependent DtxR family transcriptional regulator
MPEMVTDERLDRIEQLLEKLIASLGERSAPSYVLMTTREVADCLGMHPESVRKLHRVGLLRHARGHRNPLKFDIDEIERYRRDLQP